MTKNIFKYVFLPLVFCCLSFSKYEKLYNQKVPVLNTKEEFRYRKYSHVKQFYKRLAVPITNLCMEHKVPPAVVLSILSLESGWGQGYVGKITGNFMALNAKRSEIELPALRIAKNKKSGKVILRKKVLSNTNDSLIIWQNRPASLKKDYRPNNIAGTKDNLDYFLNHPNELTKANLKNVSDFVTRFISKDSRIKAYREARILLDEEIAQHGIDILFDDELNKRFVYTIGGRPNSYNYRKSWPKKVLSIYRNTGANKLVKDLYVHQKEFNEAW